MAFQREWMAQRAIPIFATSSPIFRQAWGAVADLDFSLCSQ
jgi:hypothetical protein